MKTANLSLEINILVQIVTGCLSKLIWSASVNPSRSYTRLSLCVYACTKYMLKLCMVMYGYALSSWAWSKSLTLKYFIVKIFSSDTPRDKNILPQTIFTWNYPMVNFSQTTVVYKIASTYKIPMNCSKFHMTCDVTLLLSTGISECQ